MKTVFIYALNCPTSGLPRYVGKSVDPRGRFQDHISCSQKEKNYKAAWIRSLTAAGLKPTMEILDEVSEIEWPQWEAAYIEFFRECGFPLVNLTSGGEDPPSRKGKPGTFTGKKHSPESIAKQKNSHRGYRPTSETKAKQRIALLGRECRPETRIKIGKGNVGKKRTLAVREAQSAARINKPIPGRNTSGFVGVSWQTQTGLWKPCFWANKKSIHVGYFSKLEDAVFARALAIAIYFTR